MEFDFSMPGRVAFGSGRLGELGAAALGFGRRAFVVRGADPRRSSRIETALSQVSLEVDYISVMGEPSFGWLNKALAQARDFRTELVIGFGGGSAIDAAKAIAALMVNPGEILDYVEVIGRGLPLSVPSLPCIAIPTTAGTGSEATKNSVLRSEEAQVKVSLRSPSMLPRLAIVDPELSLDLPPRLTACTGLDALAQLIEPYVSNRANPLTDALCLDGIRRVHKSLPLAWSRGEELMAREDMALASLFGGMALANARLGAVHGLAGPLGGRYALPHGALCAALLPAVVEVNVRALMARSPESPILGRYAEIAAVFRGQSSPAQEAGPALADFCSSLEIVGLEDLGVGREVFVDMVAKAKSSSSMQGNPIFLADEEILEILKRSF